MFFFFFLESENLFCWFLWLEAVLLIKKKKSQKTDDVAEVHLSSCWSEHQMFVLFRLWFIWSLKVKSNNL